MNGNGEIRRSATATDASGMLRAIAVGSVLMMLRVARYAVYSVLALLEPVILYGLTAVAVILCALCTFYGILTVVHPTHFPFGFAICLTVFCGLAAGTYYAIMCLLEPQANGSPLSRR